MSELVAGRYRLVQRLGAGAMGEVWLADDTALGRKVAIKAIRVDKVSPTEPGVADRILREARVASQLHHPNIVVVHDFVLDGGQPFVVMEYVEGETLAERIRREGRVSPADAARIGAQIAAALDAAHQAGFIHRDVKPANIMLTTDGVAKLADFGIARGGAEETLTETGMVIGTVAFMAPEMARSGDASPASDVWSLGATLYAAVDGHSPFAGTGSSDSATVAILSRLLTESVPPPQHAGYLGPRLIRMLAVDPSRRPTADEAAGLLRAPASADLDGIVTPVRDVPPPPVVAPLPTLQPSPAALGYPGYPPTAGPSILPGLPSGPLPALRPARSNKTPILISLLVLMLVAGGGAAVVIATGGKAHPAAVATTPTPVGLEAPTPTPTHSSSRRLDAATPSAEPTTEIETFPSISKMSLNVVPPTVGFPDDGFDGSPAPVNAASDVAQTSSWFGPQGDYLYVPMPSYKDRDAGAILLVDLHDGAVVDGMSDPHYPTDVAVSADGGRLYASNYDGSLTVYETLSGNLIQTIPLPGTPTGVLLSDDGLTAYVLNWAQGTTAASLEVVDLAKGAITREVSMPAGASPTAEALLPDGRVVVGAGSSLAILQPDGHNLVPTAGGTSLWPSSHGQAVFYNDLVAGSSDGAISWDGRFVVRANATTPSVVIDDLANGGVTEVDTFRNPYNVQVAPDGEEAYVVNFAGTKVMTVSLEDGQVTDVFNLIR